MANDTAASEPVAPRRRRAPRKAATAAKTTKATKTTKAAAKPRRRRVRAPDATREALLRAAVAEFAREGYGGARVDRISRAAKSNDRMLYYYFASKEKLFHHVIEHCYADLVKSEEALDLDLENPREALARIVAFNWDYYWRKPELLSLLASENRFKGRHVKNNIRGIFASTQLDVLDRVLSRGVAQGEFSADVDRLTVFLTILSLTYFYRANLYTLSSYLQIDLRDTGRRAAWLAHVQTMIADLVCKRPASIPAEPGRRGIDGSTPTASSTAKAR